MGLILEAANINLQKSSYGQITDLKQIHLFLQKGKQLGHLLGIDYGRVRTGISYSDELQMIAAGLVTIPTKELITYLIDYIKKNTVVGIVIGMPLQMNGTPSEIEVDISLFVQKLKKTLPNLPVFRQDERFTSKMALQSLVSTGVKKSKRQQKGLVDEVSATLILQSFLDKSDS